MAERTFVLGCVVMAAGNASRFGENKLQILLEGKSLIRRALDAVPAEEFSCVSVVTQYPAVEELAREYGFTPIRNEHPQWGISHTIHLGIEALSHCDGILFMVSDQPMLRRETVAREIAAFRADPERIVALSYGGSRGNPCVFPRSLFPELLALEGDRGGSAVIRRYPDRLFLVEALPQELEDVDTPQALENMKKE